MARSQPLHSAAAGVSDKLAQAFAKTRSSPRAYLDRFASAAPDGGMKGDALFSTARPEKRERAAQLVPAKV